MAYDFKSLNILVVDDSDLILELMKTILENLGVGHVTLAQDGQSALQEIQDRRFDLAFVDWKMEPMDGIALTKVLRASTDDSLKFLPVIMISGFTEERRVREAMSSGVTEFLAKPLTAATVYSRLAWVIEHPRDFIKSDTYFGPDRRRRAEEIDHPDRRRSSPTR